MDIQVIRKKIQNYIPYGIQSVGFNAYIHSDGYARIKGGMKYCVKGAYTSLSFATTLDGSRSSVTLVADTLSQDDLELQTYQRFMSELDGYLFITGGDASTTCVNLVWSGYRNTDYEVGVKMLRTLPILTYFPQGMRGIGTVRDILNREKAIQKIGEKIFNELSFSQSSTGVFYATIPGIASFDDGVVATILCDDYDTVSFNNLSDGKCAIHNGALYIQDSAYGSATAFINAKGSNKVDYELSSYIETIFSPEINMSLSVSDFGIEEFVFQDGEAVGRIPCAILYQDNLRDRLRTLVELTGEELAEVLAIL